MALREESWESSAVEKKPLTKEEREVINNRILPLLCVRDYTWPELLEYNICFLKGEIQGTFYHAGPLISDQVPDDLIAITKRGMFTTDGQGAQITKGLAYDTHLPYLNIQRAYLDAYLPLSIAEQILRGASRDPEVVFELTLIRTGQQMYVSEELASLWENGNSFSLTKSKITAPEGKWKYYTNVPSKAVDGAMYVMIEEEFTRWNEWVEDGLCYLIIADKEYGQEPKSLPVRILGYLDANTEETSRKH